MSRQRIFTIGKEVNRYGALLDVILRIACEIETIEMGWTCSIYSTCAGMKGIIFKISKALEKSPKILMVTMALAPSKY